MNFSISFDSLKADVLSAFEKHGNLNGIVITVVDFNVIVGTSSYFLLDFTRQIKTVVSLFSDNQKCLECFFSKLNDSLLIVSEKQKDAASLLRLKSEVLFHLTHAKTEKQHNFIKEYIAVLLNLSALDKGILACDSDGWNALHYAAKIGDLSILRRLQINPHFNVFSEGFTYSGKNAFHIAIQCNQLAFAKEWLHLKDAINTKIPFGYYVGLTPLLIAIVFENKQALEFCLAQKNMDFKAKNPLGQNALHFAAEKKESGLFDFLCAQEGFSELLDEEDIFGRTPSAVLNANWVDVSQNPVLDSMERYLAFRERENVIDEEGSCFSFGFFGQYYFNQNKNPDYYFSLDKDPEYYQLKGAIASWDGKEASLKEKHAVANLSGNYEDLEDLFNHWINDFLWIQHTNPSLVMTTGWFDQGNLSQKYEWVKKEGAPSIEVLLPQTKCVLTKQQIEELVGLWSARPGAILLFSVNIPSRHGRHLITVRMLPGGSFFYYEGNLPLRPKIFHSSEDVADLFFDFSVHVVSQESMETVETDFKVIYFTNSLSAQPFAIEKLKENSPNGYSPLHAAIFLEDKALFDRALKDPLCNPNAEDKHKNTPLCLTIIMKQHALFENLVADMRTDINLNSPLLVAIKMQNFQAFNVLIKNQKCDLSYALYTAIEAKQMAFIEVLSTDPRCDLNEESGPWGETPFVLAAREGNLDVLLFLLKAGVDVFKTTSLGTSTLQEAAVRLTTPKAVDLLLKFIPDINREDATQSTLLHYATQWRNEYMKQCLLERGALLNRPNTQGQMVVLKDGQAVVAWIPLLESMSD